MKKNLNFIHLVAMARQRVGPKSFTAGNLARFSGASAETIRSYENHGLVEPAVRSESGYNLHARENVARIRFTRRATEMGFSFRETKKLLDLLSDPETSCADVGRQAALKIADLETRIRELERTKQKLEILAGGCDCRGTARECSIFERLSA